MIDVLELTIQGFGCFVQEQEIKLAPRSGYGLYMLCGRNLVEPELGSNGSGKSTVWNALSWCWYGKTTRGVKAKGIINWSDQALCCVTSRFRIDHRVFTLTRTQTPNTLALEEVGQEPRVVEQEEIDRMLGSYELFLYRVVMGQFNEFFFDIGATAKLNLFSDVLNLGGWEKASDAAKKCQVETQTRIDASETAVASVDGTIKTLRSQIEEARSTLDQWQSEAKDNERRMRAELKPLELRVEELTEALNVESEDLKKLVTRRDKLDGEVRTLAEGLTSAERKQYEFRSQKKAAEADIEMRVAATKELETIKRCPWCKQGIPEHHTSMLMGMAATEIGRLEESVTKIKAELGSLASTIKAHQATIEGRTSEMERLVGNVEDIRTSIQQKSGERTRIKSQIQVLGGRIENLVSERTNRRAELEKLEARLEEARESRKAKNAKLERDRGMAADLKALVGEFKNVRLWLVEQAILALEVRTNNVLAELGLRGWSIRFEIERATEKGVIRGFQVIIHSPNSPDGVPWEAWSGGETQRLRIAGAIGMADLIRAHRGFDCSLEVWDEPTAHLAAEGVDDLVAFFADRARKEQRHIWIVDHRSVDAGDFDAKSTVVKTRNGSWIDPPSSQLRLETEATNRLLDVEQEEESEASE